MTDLVTLTSADVANINVVKRIRRSPADLIAEAEETLARLKTAAALKSASDDPTVTLVSDALESINSQLREASKGFADNGPQSFEQRITSHQLWIDEIQALRTLSGEQKEDLEEVRDRLKAYLGNVSARAVEGSVPPQDEVQEEIQVLMDTDADFNLLSEAYIDAKNARLRFAASKKPMVKQAGNPTSQPQDEVE